MGNEKTKNQVIQSIVELLHQIDINQLEELMVFIKNYIL